MIRSIIAPKRLFLWRSRNRLHFEADSDSGADSNSRAYTAFDFGTDSGAHSGADSGVARAVLSCAFLKDWFVGEYDYSVYLTAYHV